MTLRKLALILVIAWNCPVTADEAFVVFEFHSNGQPSGSSNYIVLPGDTLGRIVYSFYGKSVNQTRLFDEIVANNPNSFVNGDPNRLLSGSTLYLPNSGSEIGGRGDEIYFF